VNCNGRVFLEPLSALIEGSKYVFRVLGSQERIDPIGRIRHFALIETPLGTSYCEIASGDTALVPEIECRVRRVRKGHAFLELATNPIPCCRQGKWEKMLVLSALHYYQGIRCFLLQDAYGNGHSIPYSTYKRFGLRTGVWSDFRIVSVKPDEHCLVEPRHPLYEPGDVAVFTVRGTAEATDQSVSKHQLILLNDEKGFDAILFVTEENRLKYPLHAQLSGTIKRIKKGIPVLEDSECRTV
jgi:hypothetical protein